jgi:hypothetical protein
MVRRPGALVTVHCTQVESLPFLGLLLLCGVAVESQSRYQDPRALIPPCPAAQICTKFNNITSAHAGLVFIIPHPIDTTHGLVDRKTCLHLSAHLQCVLQLNSKSISLCKRSVCSIRERYGKHGSLSRLLRPHYSTGTFAKQPFYSQLYIDYKLLPAYNQALLNEYGASTSSTTASSTTDDPNGFTLGESDRILAQVCVTYG